MKKIIKYTTLGWIASVNTNEKGDNIVDPYERVDIENASRLVHKQLKLL